MRISIKRMLCCGFSLSALLSLGATQAQQRLEMEGTAIIGNKELPKVLTIVPWKSAEPVILEVPAYDSVLDQPFQPVERGSFARQTRFYQQLHPLNASQP